VPAVRTMAVRLPTLDPSNIDVGTLRALLRPAAAEHMIAYKVCRAVNSSRGDSSTFVEPI